MSRSAFLTFTAVVGLIYGLGLTLAPATINGMHGIAGTAATDLLARSFGSALLGMGVMAWLARNAADSDGLTALLRGAFVYVVINLVVVLYAVSTGVLNAMGWGGVIADLLLVVGFGYFGVVRSGRA